MKKLTTKSEYIGQTLIKNIAHRVFFIFRIVLAIFEWLCFHTKEWWKWLLFCVKKNVTSLWNSCTTRHLYVPPAPKGPQSGGGNIYWCPFLCFCSMNCSYLYFSMLIINIMFWADIRVPPKISLNVNLIKVLLEEAFPEKNITDRLAEMITRNSERYLSNKLHLAKSVSVLTAFHAACDDFFSWNWAHL